MELANNARLQEMSPVCGRDFVTSGVFLETEVNKRLVGFKVLYELME